MTETQLMEDLEHRRDLAAELAGFADGKQGLGLGTALAGLMACMNPVLISLAAKVMMQDCTWRTRVEPFILMCSLLLLLNAFVWLLLKDWLQARLYRSHGEAGSLLPQWEIRVGIVMLAAVGLAAIWQGASALLAVNSPGNWERWPSKVLGIATLTYIAAVALLGATAVMVASWRRVKGWRNWLGWLALCAPFFLFTTMSLFDLGPGGKAGFLAAVAVVTLIAVSFYLPILAIYIGLRDQLRYWRLLKAVGGLPQVEE